MKLAQFILCMSSISLLACQGWDNKVDALEMNCGMAQDPQKAIIIIENYKTYSNAKAWTTKPGGELKPLAISERGCISIDVGGDHESIVIRAEESSARFGAIAQGSTLEPQSVRRLALTRMPAFLHQLDICASANPMYVTRFPYALEIPRAQLPQQFSLNVRVSDSQGQPHEPLSFHNSGAEPLRLHSFLELPEGQHDLALEVKDILEPDSQLSERRFNCRLMVDTIKPLTTVLASDGTELTSHHSKNLSPGERLTLTGSEAIQAQYCFVSQDEANLRLCGTAQDGGVIGAPAKGRWILELSSVDKAGHTRHDLIPITIHDARTVAYVEAMAKASTQGISKADVLKALHAESTRNELGTETESRQVLNSTKAALLSAVTRTLEVARFPIPSDSARFYLHAETGRLFTWPDDTYDRPRDCFGETTQVQVWDQHGKALKSLGPADSCIYKVFISEKSKEIIIVDARGLISVASIVSLETRTLDLRESPYKEHFERQRAAKVLFMDNDDELIFYFHDIPRDHGLGAPLLLSFNLKTETMEGAESHALPDGDYPWELVDSSARAEGGATFLHDGLRFLRCSRLLQDCIEFAGADQYVSLGRLTAGRNLRHFYSPDNRQIFIWDRHKPEAKPVIVPGDSVFEADGFNGIIIQDGSTVKILNQKNLSLSYKFEVGSLPIKKVLYDQLHEELFLMNEEGFVRSYYGRVLERVDYKDSYWHDMALSRNGKQIFALQGSAISRIRLNDTLSPQSSLFVFGKKRSALLATQLEKKLIYSADDGREKVLFHGTVQSMVLSPGGSLALVFTLVGADGRVDIIREDGTLVHTMKGRPLESHINASDSFGAVLMESGQLEFFSTRGEFEPFSMQFKEFVHIEGLAPDAAKALLHTYDEIFVVDALKQGSRTIISADAKNIDISHVNVSSEFPLFTVTIKDPVAASAKGQIWNWEGSMLAEHAGPREMSLFFLQDCPFLQTSINSDGDVTLFDPVTFAPHTMKSERLFCSSGSSVVLSYRDKQVTILDKQLAPMTSFSAHPSEIFPRRSGFYVQDETAQLIRSIDAKGQVVETAFQGSAQYVKDNKLWISRQEGGLTREWILNEELMSFRIPDSKTSSQNTFGKFTTEGCFFWSMLHGKDLNLPCQDMLLKEPEPGTFLITGGRDKIHFLPLRNDELSDLLRKLLTEEEG